MSMRIAVVDDDVSVRRIIANVIKEYELGTVVGESGDGASAQGMIQEMQPDVVLVDLLLPGQDGLALIKSLAGMPKLPSFIMISQSDSQPMITGAYESGVEFYIHKPVNVLELVSVINKVEERLRLKQLMTVISRTAPKSGGEAVAAPGSDPEGDIKTKIYRIFSDIGIIGEVGARNIYQMAMMVLPYMERQEPFYQLNDIYQQLSVKNNVDVKTLEQRVRRTIMKALQNVANIGLEDYYNTKFQEYSTTLFEFKEVRQEMSLIQGKSQYRGKINVKKFIEGLLFLQEQKM